VRRSLVIALCAALVPAGAAADWETSRRTVVDPLNTSLHRHLPSFVKARDLDAVLGVYTTDTGTGLRWDDAGPVVADGAERIQRWTGPGGPEAIRARWQGLLDLFASVDKAELRIDRVHWRQPDDRGALPADVRLVVRGTRADGTAVQLVQSARLRVAPGEHDWRIAAEEVTARTVVSRARPAFAVATAAAGLADVHTNDASPAFHLFGGGPDAAVRASGGVAVGDFDGDGCEDVFLAGAPGARLWRNRCDGTFADVTAAAGLPVPWPTVATGAVFFDYDDDGAPDLWVSAIAGGDRLFRNLGGRFEDVTARAGIAPHPWGSMPAVADYDRDGFLDVYVARMGDHATGAPRPSFAATNGVPDTLWRNRGDGTFADVTAEAGVGSRGWNLAAAWGDYDGDGWPDLYVANEFGPNALFRNRRDGTFEDRARASGTADGGASMGVAWGDYDGDGDLDLFVSNMHANSGWALFHPDFPTPIPWRFRLFGLFTSKVRNESQRIVDRLVRGSSLYRNDGDGTFTDVSDAAGVRDGQWGWSAEFVDYDLDGRLDLYAVDGFVSGPLLDDV
jgi:hypothetical protein